MLLPCCPASLCFGVGGVRCYWTRCRVLDGSGLCSILVMMANQKEEGEEEEEVVIIIHLKQPTPH